MVKGFRIKMHDRKGSSMVFLVALHARLSPIPGVRSTTVFDARLEIRMTCQALFTRKGLSDRVTGGAVRHSLQMRVRIGQLTG